MYHEHPDLWAEFLRIGLKEDGWPWDWTALGLSDKKTQARIVAKSEGVWAADGLVVAMRGISTSIEIQSKIKNGKRFKAQDTLMTWKGSAHEILAFERPFLNLAGYVSGIATMTSRLVKKVEEACPCCTPRVTMTRKTLPSYRDLSILGLQVGGGYAHRVSLSGGVLIKENHIAVAGSIQNAVDGARSIAPHGLKIEVEVRSLKELQQALKAQVDCVLLDNFQRVQVEKALEIVSNHEYCPLIEVSGGLTEANIAEYAIEGVDVLSVDSLTHSVKSIDLSLLINE